jgi:hypothetical protein
VIQEARLDPIYIYYYGTLLKTLNKGITSANNAKWREGNIHRNSSFPHDVLANNTVCQSLLFPNTSTRSGLRNGVGTKGL